MDASATQSARAFRRPRKYRPRWLFVIVVALAVASPWWNDDAKVDPALVQSGPYQVARVNTNGSLRLIVPNTKPNEIDVRWLAIDMTKPVEATQWINSMLDQAHPIQLRLDRRRLDQDGNLQAYFFKDDLLLNAELVRLGFAVESTHPSDFAPIARQIRQAKTLNAATLLRSK